MPDGSRSSESAGGGMLRRRLARGARRGAGGVVRTWSCLSPEQRIAGIGAVLLIVSTFGPFSFVEGSIVLVGLSVLVLLRTRAMEKSFHLPFGDGTVIAAAGIWCGFLILVRLFERPLGLNLLALGCAVILFLAGARERAKRPADDLPAERRRETRYEGARDRAGFRGSEWPTRPLADPATRPLPDDPPEPGLPRNRR
jgi:hypothetical protein